MSRLLPFVAVFALTLAAAPAGAEPIPWTMEVWGEGGGSSDYGGIFFGPGIWTHEGVGSFSFFSVPYGGIYHFGLYSSDDPPGGPLLPEQSEFNLHVHLMDRNSGESGDLTFTNSLAGSFHPWQSNIFLSTPGSPSQSLVLGGNRYTVLIVDGFAQSDEIPDAPRRSQYGVIEADLVVEPAQEAPEPATICLCGTALLSLFAVRLGQKLRTSC